MLWATVDATETVSSNNGSGRTGTELQGGDTVTVYIVGGILASYLSKGTGARGPRVLL